MSFKLGNTNIGSIYVGSNKIGSAYVGSVKVYQSGPPFRTVTIGTQTWAAENLAINDGGSGIYSKNATVNNVNFGTQYYYNHDAAVRIANSIPGWRLPTKDEWLTLFKYTGGGTVKVASGKKLASTSGWKSYQGTDDYGFTAIPIGYRSIANTANHQGTWSATNGDSAYYWALTTYSSSGDIYTRSSYYVEIYSSGSKPKYDVSKKDSEGIPVRLIKDT